MPVGNGVRIASYLQMITIVNTIHDHRHPPTPRQDPDKRRDFSCVMNPQGQVLRGSGYSILDKAAQAMLRRAEPLPSPPPELTQARLEIVAPVAFDRR